MSYALSALGEELQQQSDPNSPAKRAVFGLGIIAICALPWVPILGAAYVGSRQTKKPLTGAIVGGVVGTAVSTAIISHFVNS